MKKRVCFISFLAYPLFNPNTAGRVIGGAEINMVLLARSLASRYEVSFLVDDYGQQDIEQYDGIQVIKFKGGTDAISLPEKLIRAMKAFHQLFTMKADVFIYTTANSFLGKLVFIQKSLRRRKVIFRLSSDRNLDLDWYEKKYGAGFTRMYHYGLINASQIVCQTEKQYTLLRNRFGLNGKVIPNGFPVREEMDIVQKKNILWVSRCLPLKKPLQFLELARRLPDESFVMIMPQNQSGNREIDQQIRDLTQAVKEQAAQLNNVTLKDYVPYDQIQPYFDQARALVCTSEMEGFPNTFIQACLGGTAILSFHIDPDGMIEQNDLGVVCGDDFAAAESFIRRMNDDRLRYYRDRTLSYVKAHHSIDNSVQLYEELIANTMEAGRSKRLKALPPAKPEKRGLGPLPRGVQ